MAPNIKIKNFIFYKYYIFIDGGIERGLQDIPEAGTPCPWTTCPRHWTWHESSPGLVSEQVIHEILVLQAGAAWYGMAILPLKGSFWWFFGTSF